MNSKELANRIAEELFTDGSGKTAERLVMVREELRGDMKHVMGGWCKSAVVAVIVKALNASTLPAAAEAREQG